ncbi:MAG: hypothetical protein H6574_20630 [Lewinellaceae bacterium]|nr:hypothetical protein [Saprospiraceae bacterium]MCB9333472.1 hypothetical protein [Lewinellaceae bacterium]
MIVDELIAKVREKISQNEIEDGIEELSNNLRDSAYYNEILIQSGRLKQVSKDRRLGILSIDEINRIETQIKINILELLEAIKKDRQIIPIVRANQKWQSDIDLRIDIRVFLFEINQDDEPKYYKTMDFADANDFLNQVYLEISDYVAPKTYGKDWVLVDRETDEELTYSMIEERIMQEETLMEKFFDDDLKGTDFVVRKKN